MTQSEQRLLLNRRSDIDVHQTRIAARGERIMEESNDINKNAEAKIEHYDLIVDGTGLVESIVACAASRSGKSVLHLDSNDYYGCNSASFPLQDFLSWCRAAIQKEKSTISLLDASTNIRIGGVLDFAVGKQCNFNTVGDHENHQSVVNIPNNQEDIVGVPSSLSNLHPTFQLDTGTSRLRVINFQDIGNSLLRDQYSVLLFQLL